jgi:acetyl-CoA carboxylase biotin carboxyl carrier protein
MALSDEDVREILRIIDESPLQELRIETEGFVLNVRKGLPGGTASWPPERPRGGQQAASPGRSGEPGPTTETATTLDAPAAPATPDAPAAPAVPDVPDGLLTIEAPMLGTFYRAEGPGQDPLVEVGARIEADTVVCIIEVMKMMNSVPAGVSGTIVEVCPQNAELVEYGQPLFRLEPA